MFLIGAKYSEKLNEKYFKHIGFKLLCLTVLLLPFPRAIPMWAMGLFIFSGFYYWLTSFRKTYESFKKDIFLLSGPLLYFLLHLIWIPVQNPPFSYYSSAFIFFLVPVLGYPIFSSSYFSSNLLNVVKFFIFGLLTICLFEYARALWNSISFAEGTFTFNPDVDFNTAASSSDFISAKSRFRSFQLSFLEHPSYLSMKVLFAVCLIIEFWNELKINKWILLFIVLILVIYLYSLSTRAAFLSGLFLLIYYILKAPFVKQRIWILILLIPILLYSFYKVSMLNTRVREKTEDLIANFNKYRSEPEKTDTRLLAWISSAEMIRHRPLIGYGLRSRDLLAEEYFKKGFDYEAKIKINPHNQFLETQLAFGIPGSIALFLMLFAPLIKRPPGLRVRLYHTFIIILITSLFFASLITGHWGTIFYSFFYCIIVLGRLEQN